MKKLLVLIPLLLDASEDFISHYEYGEMLYNNPRGISCAQCHGKLGEGKVIVTFQEKTKKEVLKGSDIRKKSFLEMRKSVNSDHEVMPRYYLTQEEIHAIFDFIQENKIK